MSRKSGPGLPTSLSPWAMLLKWSSSLTTLPEQSLPVADEHSAIFEEDEDRFREGDQGGIAQEEKQEEKQGKRKGKGKMLVICPLINDLSEHWAMDIEIVMTATHISNISLGCCHRLGRSQNIKFKILYREERGKRYNANIQKRFN